MQSAGIKKQFIPSLLGNTVTQYWELVNIPFAAEYPGERKWNKYAPQFMVEPKMGDYPTWLLILNHLGANLDSAVDASPWCRDNAIITGGLYLKCWIASLLQYPLEPLPYLFFYSNKQNTGKSTFHEGLSLLFTGCVRADHALTNNSGFNGELEGAVLCIVEEVNLQRNKSAYEKIKDWVTAKVISIRPLYRQAYDIINSTHWVQCANDPSFCPIFTGDTRINVIRVDELKEPIPKSVLLKQLQAEAPAFLYDMLEFELPEPCDRLRIPCLETSEKSMQADINKSLLEVFIDENIVFVDGATIVLSDFIERFTGVLPPAEKVYWSPRRVSNSLPSTIVRGKKGEHNHTHLGNVCWNDAIVEPKKKLVRVKDRLQ